MAEREKRRGGVTAAELMAELANDPEYQARVAEHDAELAAVRRERRKEERPIVADLHRVGIEVDSVWDLYKAPESSPVWMPVLFDHLERGGYSDFVMASMGQALAVKSALPYWDRIRGLYLRATGPDERESLAAALASMATKNELDDVIELLLTDSLDVSQVHFVSVVLRRGGERGREIIEGLADDPVVGLEATALLKRRRRH